MSLLHLLRQNPVIAAVKDNASLQLAIDSECQFISVLYGNICTISNIVKKIKNAGKYAFIHVDLLEGASNKEVVIQFLKLVTEADGIISTKASMLKAARAEGFFCIHRLFIVDSISFHNIDKQVAQSNPDCIEILPGCMPKVLGWGLVSLIRRLTRLIRLTSPQPRTVGRIIRQHVIGNLRECLSPVPPAPLSSHQPRQHLPVKIPPRWRHD